MMSHSSGSVISSIKGVPSIKQQAFPYEVWLIGETEVRIEMGTPGHSVLINAAKSKKVVTITTSVNYETMQNYR